MFFKKKMSGFGECLSCGQDCSLQNTAWWTVCPRCLGQVCTNCSVGVYCPRCGRSSYPADTLQSWKEVVADLEKVDLPYHSASTWREIARMIEEYRS